MNAQLTVNGQTITIELTQEQIEQLTNKKPVRKWEDLGEVTGWYVSSTSTAISIEDVTTGYLSARKIYATENQARSSVAMAMLSQLMKDVNGDWKPDWTNGDTTKYVIYCYKNSTATDFGNRAGEFLAFPTAYIRDQFLEDHKELIEEYFLMYK